MQDINIFEVRELTRKANESRLFAESRFPYLDEYEKYNNAILEKAKMGESSISFDFVDDLLDGQKSFNEIQWNQNRIYPRPKGGQSFNNTYNYPNYLVVRGFNVEIRKSIEHHGYKSKSYYISW